MSKVKVRDHVHQKPEGADNPFESGWDRVISGVRHPSFNRHESNNEDAVQKSPNCDSKPWRLRYIGWTRDTREDVRIRG